MIEPDPLDIDHLRGWIGRTTTASDVISPQRARELWATLDIDVGSVVMGDLAPLAIHWCLAPLVAATTALGPDGHPPRGDFLPPVPLPRRMWASSRLQLVDPLRIGDAIERRSRIVDVTVKQGRSGTLCFVALDHDTVSERGTAVIERQTIVYRGAEPVVAPPAIAATPLAASRSDIDWHSDRVASTALLFRYSALTFNAHRIHYDRDYARDEEGYPGLVVQGPLLATQLLDFAATIVRRPPGTFTFRGLQPLFDNVPYRLCARGDDTALSLWIETGDGSRTTEAEARW